MIRRAKGVRKKCCTTRLYVQMVHTTSIFINPFHANFESNVHAVAYYKRKEAEVYIYSFFNLGTIWGGWSTPHPGRFTRGKETWYPMYMRLGGPQGKCAWLRKMSLLPGFDPRTVQPTYSRYTDCVIPAHHDTPYSKKKVWWSGSMET